MRRLLVGAREARFGRRLFADRSRTRSGASSGLVPDISFTKQVVVVVAHIESSAWLWLRAVFQYSERVSGRQSFARHQ